MTARTADRAAARSAATARRSRAALGWRGRAMTAATTCRARRARVRVAAGRGARPGLRRDRVATGGTAATGIEWPPGSGNVLRRRRRRRRASQDKRARAGSAAAATRGHTARTASSPGEDGAPNTGGGGGAAGRSGAIPGSPGGAGGAGVVVVRYAETTLTQIRQPIMPYFAEIVSGCRRRASSSPRPRRGSSTNVGGTWQEVTDPYHLRRRAVRLPRARALLRPRDAARRGGRHRVRRGRQADRERGLRRVALRQPPLRRCSLEALADLHAGRRAPRAEQGGLLGRDRPRHPRRRRLARRGVAGDRDAERGGRDVPRHRHPAQRGLPRRRPLHRRDERRDAPRDQALDGRRRDVGQRGDAAKDGGRGWW